MLKPQDIGQEGVDEPLIKFEFSSDDDRLAWGVLIIGIAIAALLYALGATLPLAGLSGVAFIIVIITVSVFAFLRTKLSKAKMSEEVIDQKVEQFKQDLVDTYNGYDVEYSADEVLAAADAYREQLMNVNKESEDIEIDGVGDIVKLMGKDIIDSREKKKNRKKAEKEQKRNRRKGK